MAIRIANHADLPAMLAIYRPYVETTTYSFETELPAPEAFRARFDEHMRQCPWLVWEEDGCVLGYAYGGRAYERAAYAWCAEISIYLAPQAQGKGVGRALYAVLERCLQRQGYAVVYAVVTSENTGSLAFHEKLGYTLAAHFERNGYKFGRWIGVYWLEKRLPGPEYPTRMPQPWQPEWLEL